jgi:hypothetical protein
MKTIKGIQKKKQLGFQIIGSHKCKKIQLFPMVFTSWLLNLLYSNNEEISVHARMCTRDIFQFNSLVCPIFFAQKFWTLTMYTWINGKPLLQYGVGTNTLYIDIENNVNQSNPLK